MLRTFKQRKRTLHNTVWFSTRVGASESLTRAVEEEAAEDAAAAVELRRASCFEEEERFLAAFLLFAAFFVLLPPAEEDFAAEPADPLAEAGEQASPAGGECCIPAFPPLGMVAASFPFGGLNVALANAAASKGSAASLTKAKVSSPSPSCFAPLPAIFRCKCFSWLTAFVIAQFSCFIGITVYATSSGWCFTGHACPWGG